MWEKQEQTTFLLYAGQEMWHKCNCHVEGTCQELKTYQSCGLPTQHQLKRSTKWKAKGDKSS